MQPNIAKSRVTQQYGPYVLLFAFAAFLALFATKIAVVHDRTIALQQQLTNSGMHYWILIAPVAFMIASAILEYSIEIPSRFFRGFLQAIGILVAILGGASVGREVPSIIVGIAFFEILQIRLFPQSKKIVTSNYVSGAASGMAACFESPLVGIAYAIESYGAKLKSGFRTIGILTIILAGLISQTMPIGIGLQKASEAFSFSFSLRALSFVLLLGFISGVCSWLVIFWSYAVASFSPQSKMFRVWFLPAMCGVAIGIIAVVTNQSPGAGIDIVNQSLFSPDSANSKFLLFGKFAALLLTILAGFEAWIFTPAMAVGYGLGSYLSELASFSETAQFGFIGMSAFLAGVARAPLTAVLIVSVFAGNPKLISLLLLASLVSYFISKQTTERMSRGMEWLNSKFNR